MLTSLVSTAMRTTASESRAYSSPEAQTHVNQLQAGEFFRDLGRVCCKALVFLQFNI